MEKIDLQIINKINQKMNEYNSREDSFHNKYGYIRKIVHCDTRDFKCIAVGKSFIADKNWKTFPDFLFDYLKLVLGKGWWEYNINKVKPEQHQIISWYLKMLEFQGKQKKNSDGFYYSIPDDSMLSYTLLSYDLYTISHNSDLQERVIKRLKNSNQFQGARFELFVASTFIRAGFQINYSDESDRTQKHPEFIAEIPKTGQLIAVEAKSRHRKLDVVNKASSNKNLKLGITQLINRALRKSPNYPFIIFIDLNFPDSKKHHPNNYNHLKLEFNKSFKKNSIDNEFSIIYFTDHNLSIKNNNPRSNYCESIFAVSKTPKFEIKEMNYVLSKLNKAISQFGNIPNSFSEMDFNNTIEL